MITRVIPRRGTLMPNLRSGMAVFSVRAACALVGKHCATRRAASRCAVWLAVWALACSPAVRAGPPQEVNAPIRPDRRAYLVARYGDSEQVRLIAVYENRSSDTVWVATCGGKLPVFHAERWSGRKWEVGYAPICALGAIQPSAVPPHRARTDTLTLTNSDSPNTYRNFSGPELPGTYRLVYQIHESWIVAARIGRFGDLLPSSNRVSTNFGISR